MIVADTNLLAYFLLQGAFTDLAERAYALRCFFRTMRGIASQKAP